VPASLSNTRFENDDKFSKLVDVMPSATKLVVDKEQRRSSSLKMPDLLFCLVVLPSRYLATLDRVFTVLLTNPVGSLSKHLEGEILSCCLFKLCRIDLYIVNIIDVLTIISKILNRFEINGIT
jgi:hypothetical protein